MFRQNAYLSPKEKAALNSLAEDFGMSASGILRIALRIMAGLPIPEEIAFELQKRYSDAIDTTRNEEIRA